MGCASPTNWRRLPDTVLKLDVSRIPAELRQLAQWVIWREEVRNGKPTKVPYQPHRPDVGAKADDPSTWGTFDQALSAANGASGVGFEFSAGDPYVGIDIDKCRNPETGALSETAASWIDAFATYTEVSPTGTGIHMIGRGRIPGSRNRKGVWEVYDRGRYFTVTGNTLTWTTVSDVQDSLDELYAYLWPEPVNGVPTSVAPNTLDDRDLLELMFRARNGDAIRDLYEGKWDARYTSHSEADYAFCLHLAFWTGRHAGRMDAIFRASGLMRPKWDDRRPEHGTYGADTVAKAIQQTTEVYEPRPRVAPAIIAPVQEIPRADDAPAPFKGLSHAEALALELAPDRYLINDLIPVGAVGTIAGVPETHKSFIAQAAAVRIAAGEGELFGRSVGEQTNVGFFWQDDSTRAEVERIKLFETIHASPPELPVWWFLNLGIQLPDDLERLRLTIEEHSLGLIVLDSFYNFATSAELKEAAAEILVAQLKREIADVCECTVVIVDHMPWATDTNRGRLRSYGGVFKGAATRFGIYIDAVGNKLWIEARGNNIVGFKRTLAEWDADALEMRLISSQEKVEESEYEQRILDYLSDHPDALTEELVQIKGTKTELLAARGRLLEQNRVVRRRERTSSGPYRWNLSTGAKNTGSTYQTNLDEPLDRFGGSTGSPLRGDTSSEPVSETNATPNSDDDDGIPF